uniref:Complement C8 gamma chain n=1 Tax=Varanus komodoensis TaxID=61221 RepID=A0A8D2J2B9_VARKO
MWKGWIWNQRTPRPLSHCPHAGFAGHPSALPSGGRVWPPACLRCSKNGTWRTWEGCPFLPSTAARAPSEPGPSSVGRLGIPQAAFLVALGTGWACEATASLPRQFAGKWFLVSVAARCAHLSENSDNLEATNIVVSVPSTRALPAGLLVDTFRPLDGHCWNIKQMYFPTKTPGRFQLKGRRKLVDVVVQTDYSSYAILYYQKDRKISAKLYGRAVRVSDAVMATFEQRVAAVGMNEDSIFYFPVYGELWMPPVPARHVGHTHALPEPP